MLSHLPQEDNPANRVEPTVSDDAPPTVPGQVPPQSPRVPKIESEPINDIIIGAGHKLIVPREDIDADLDDSEEVLISRVLKIRKPKRNEWIVLKRESELNTRLLPYKKNPDDFDTDYYYVDSHLRGPIRDQLKVVRVFLFHSVNTKTFGLWPIKATSGNSWYESLNALLRKPPSFFSENMIRVIPDLNAKHDKIRKKKIIETVNWLTPSTEELLGEALGDGRFIASVDHPLYRDLTDGEEVC